jgi:hypothetical protein
MTIRQLMSYNKVTETIRTLDLAKKLRLSRLILKDLVSDYLSLTAKHSVRRPNTPVALLSGMFLGCQGD